MIAQIISKIVIQDQHQFDDSKKIATEPWFSIPQDILKQYSKFTIPLSRQ